MTPNFWQTVNLVISLDYSWFLAKNLAYVECPIMKFHYRNSSNGRSIFCLPHQPKVSYFFLHWVSIRWVSVVEFHDPTLDIGKVFGQESTVVKWNYQILSLHLVTVCQKVPILDFQSEFSMWKIIRICLNFFSMKNSCLGAHFLWK